MFLLTDFIEAFKDSVVRSNSDGIPAAVPVIFFYHRLNRYSFNALAGALDSDTALADLPIALARTAEELKAAADAVLTQHGQTLVALSMLTCQAGEMQHLVRQLRSDYGTRVMIVGGGPHATAEPGEILAWGADVIFRGEAEAAFPAFLKRMAAGQDWRDITGIAFRRGDEMVLTPLARPLDIDVFPSFSPKRGMLGPIEITRGCPFACSFCQTSRIFGTRPRHRSIARVAEQATMLPRRARKVVRLLSPNAFSYGSPDGLQLNLAAMNDLLATLRGILAREDRIIFGYFPSEVRPEHVIPETMELLRRYADNDEIVIGAQSGSTRMLEICRRSHDVGSVLAAVSLARSYGYKVIVDLIFGLPGEEAGDERETVAVMEELARRGARIHPHVFAPLPQTAFAGARPGKISPAVRRALEELEQRRALYGKCIPPAVIEAPPRIR